MLQPQKEQGPRKDGWKECLLQQSRDTYIGHF